MGNDIRGGGFLTRLLQGSGLPVGRHTHVQLHAGRQSSKHVYQQVHACMSVYTCFVCTQVASWLSLTLLMKEYPGSTSWGHKQLALLVLQCVPDSVLENLVICSEDWLLAPQIFSLWE